MTIGNNSVKDTMSKLTGSKISSQVFIAWKFRFFFLLRGVVVFWGDFFKMSLEFKPSSLFSDTYVFSPPSPFSLQLHYYTKKTNKNILWQTSFLHLVTVSIAWT